MSRVLTFSRYYPSYHPRVGEPTYFVEKFWKAIVMQGISIDPKITNQFVWPDGWLDQAFESKHHTIRAGHRWKAGDWFSPRVWSGTPYRSKQIVIGPDIQVKKTWDFKVTQIKNPFYLNVELNGSMICDIQSNQAFLGGLNKLQTIATNDGLGWEDFQYWFRFGDGKDFDGQIICWNDQIEY